jgi:hypothetical protein
MSLFIILAVIGAVIGLVGYIRFSPADVLRWHAFPQDVWTDTTPWDEVVRRREGATLRLSRVRGDAANLLEKLDLVATSSARTVRFAGDVTSGKITWITRSALWGFPDFTTAEVRPDGLYVYARLRFGSADLGVNFARLSQWMAAI